MNNLNFIVTAAYPSGVLDNKCGPLNDDDPQHEEVSVADDEHADLLVALDKDLAQRRHAARPRLSGRWG